MTMTRATLSTFVTPAMAAATLGLFLSACGTATTTTNDTAAAGNATAAAPAKRPASDYLSQPLVSEIYTADPSAHVWGDGKIYVYPSHDIDGDAVEDDLGGHFEMRDYRVLQHGRDRAGRSPCIPSRWT